MSETTFRIPALRLGLNGGRTGLILGLVLMAAFLALGLSPLVFDLPPPEQIDLLSRLSGPSSVHPLGADHLGRDVLSRLIAAVPGGDWAALDKREGGYARIDASAQVTHEATATDIAAYQVPPTNQVADGTHHILLSYLDVVVQGFLREFGEAGAEAFFATTDGWDTPILNDRADPLYPRAQKLTAQEQNLTDRLIAQCQQQ